MKILNNKYVDMFLSFLIPFLILFLYFILNNKSFYDLFISDLGAQYIYLFDYLKDMFNGDASIFYSFSKGIGGSMYGTFFYYLSSPLNLLLMFFSKQNLHIGISLLIFIKIGLCGLTINYYLMKKTRLSQFNRLLFSMSYALMTYNIVYYFCVMWLDIVFLAPLVILGLDKILDNKKSKTYIGFLFISIISNYYMAYMLCIFCVLYFIYRILTQYNLKKDKQIIKQIILKFIIHSFFAGLLASFMIIPVLNELTYVYRINYGVGNLFLPNLKYFLKSIGITGASNQFYQSHFFSSFFVFSLLINYLLFVKDKNKKYFIAILFIFILSIINNNISYIWHAFTYPMLFQARFSFLISLFLIIILSEKYDKIKILSIKKMLWICFTYIAIVSIPYIIDNSDYSVFIILIDFFLLFSNLYLININKLYNNFLYNTALLFITFVFIILNLKIHFVSFEIYKSTGLILNNEILSDRLTLNDFFNNLDSNYFRVDGSDIITIDELWNIKNGSRISNFISTNNKNIMNFYEQSGYDLSSTAVISNYNQNLINGLLGIKYFYNEEETEYYKKYDEFEINEEKVSLLKTDYYKSIGYMIENNSVNINSINPIEYQNSFTNVLSGTKVYEICELEEIEKNKFRVKEYKIGKYYIYSNNKEEIDIYIDNKKIDYNNKFYFKDQKLLSDSIISVKNLNEENYKLNVYYMNEDNLKKLFEQLDEELKIESIEKNTLKGTIEVKGDKNTLMLTIPYEPGFKIFVDGKKVDYYKVFDTFIGIDLEKGEHKIELRFYTPYLKIGIIISSLSLLIIIFYLKNGSKCKKMYKKYNII